MERNEQPHEEAEETLDQINKKTGRNMPQAIATGAALVILIVACLLLSVDLFVLLVVVFMILALWELRVDFATVGLHLPVFMLWLCSSFTLIATYYSPYHLITMSLSIIVSIILVAIAASAKISVGNRLSLAVAGKLSNTDASARLESSFNHEGGEQHHSRLSHVAVSVLTVLYIPLLASCVIISLTFNGHPIAHAIMLVFLPALSDTGGLFAGAWLGKHKLSPRISPKKSVEGLVGSMHLPYSHARMMPRNGPLVGGCRSWRVFSSVPWARSVICVLPCSSAISVSKTWAICSRGTAV